MISEGPSFMQVLGAALFEYGESGGTAIFPSAAWHASRQPVPCSDMPVYKLTVFFGFAELGRLSRYSPVFSGLGCRNPTGTEFASPASTHLEEASPEPLPPGFEPLQLPPGFEFVCSSLPPPRQLPQRAPAPIRASERRRDTLARQRSSALAEPAVEPPAPAQRASERRRDASARQRSSVLAEPAVEPPAPAQRRQRRSTSAARLPKPPASWTACVTIPPRSSLGAHGAASGYSVTP